MRNLNEVYVILCNKNIKCVVDGTMSSARTVLAKLRHAGHRDGFTHLTVQQYANLIDWHIITVPIERR